MGMMARAVLWSFSLLSRLFPHPPTTPSASVSSLLLSSDPHKQGCLAPQVCRLASQSFSYSTIEGEMTPRVLICGDLVWAHDELQALLGDIADIIVMDSTDRAAFLAQLSPGGKYANIVAVYRHNSSADFIGVFDNEIIAALPPSVKWIGHNGAGYDQIDVAACAAKGILISNTPGAVDEATATTALYLLISTIRQFSLGERSLRCGTWKPPHTALHARDASSLVLGILGLGGIGSRFAAFAHALPMHRILYHSRRRVADAPAWCEYVADPETLLAQVDVLSVHVPQRSDTIGLISERWIRKMRRGAIIINTARGKIVDEDAMIRALEDGHLSSVGLDVYPEEPAVNPRLLEFPSVTLLPHMGTENQDSQRRMEVRALTNIKDFLTKGMGGDLIPELKASASPS